METLCEIPFKLDAEQIMSETFVEPGSNDAEDLKALIELAQSVGRPKAAYRVCHIGLREGDTLEIENVRFKSPMLVKNMQSVERVFPHVATCGHEMEESFSGRGDMLHEYWWDMIKTHLLAAANDTLREHLQSKFRIAKTASMHPGSADASVWPIEQQKDLFALIGDIEGEIKVRLTESCLMMPNKTTSGIIFETEKDYRSCQVCHRENCPSRQVPFSKEIWEEICSGKSD